MSGRRASRARRAVNYRALDGSDSDDDFSSPTPPTKRPRDVRTEQQRRAEETADGAGTSGISSRTKPSSKTRPSLDDKLFQKQLQVALEISRVDGSPSAAASGGADAASAESSQEAHSIKSADTVPVSQEEDLKRSPEMPRLRPEPTSQDSEEDQDEWAAPAQDGDSSESEADSGDDSDFSENEFKTKKSNKKLAPKSARKTAAARGRKSPAAAAAGASRRGRGGKTGPASKSPPAGRAVLREANPAPTLLPAVGSRSAASSTLSPASVPPLKRTGAQPKWTPPARVGGGAASSERSPQLGSPGTGLRLGLSRNVRLKPLHPSVKQVT